MFKKEASHKFFPVLNQTSHDVQQLSSQPQYVLLPQWPVKNWLNQTDCIIQIFSNTEDPAIACYLLILSLFNDTLSCWQYTAATPKHFWVPEHFVT